MERRLLEPSRMAGEPMLERAIAGERIEEGSGEFCMFIGAVSTGDEKAIEARMMGVVGSFIVLGLGVLGEIEIALVEICRRGECCCLGWDKRKRM